MVLIKWWPSGVCVHLSVFIWYNSAFSLGARCLEVCKFWEAMNICYFLVHSSLWRIFTRGMTSASHLGFPPLRYFLRAWLLITSVKYVVEYRLGGTLWRSWLGHCAASWKVADSIVIGIFHWRILSGRNMTQGSIQPLTEISIRGISWG